MNPIPGCGVLWYGWSYTEEGEEAVLSGERESTRLQEGFWEALEEGIEQP